MKLKEVREKTLDTLVMSAYKGSQWVSSLWYPQLIKKYAPQSTAFAVTFFPFYVASECFVSGMSDWESIKSRFLGLAVNYAVIPLLMFGRDGIRSVMAKKGKSDKQIKNVEKLYGMAASFGVGFLAYRAVVNRVSEALIGAGISTFVIGPQAPKLFNFVDNYKYALLGTKLPVKPYKWLKEKSPEARRNIAIGYSAFMISVGVGEYIAPNSGAQDWYPEVKEKFVDFQDKLKDMDLYDMSKFN